MIVKLSAFFVVEFICLKMYQGFPNYAFSCKYSQVETPFPTKWEKILFYVAGYFHRGNCLKAAEK